MRYGWISFTTDYGLADGFVAACHGVIATITPDVRVIDITHQVGPQRIRQGAATLAQTVPYLPESVHLGVVDPGVGTARRGVVIVAENGVLVGPDNGLLIPAAEALGGIRSVHELAEPRYRLGTRSATFHGRDLFAPAAAHLATGVPAADFGPAVPDPVRLPEPEVTAREGLLRAEVLTVDAFGNISLAATPDELRAASFTGPVRVTIGERELSASPARTFADVPAGAGIVFLDSAERPAVAVNGGSAATALDITPAETSPTCEIIQTGAE